MTATTLIAVARWLLVSAAAVALAAVVAWLGLRVLTPPLPEVGRTWVRTDGPYPAAVRVAAVGDSQVEVVVVPLGSMDAAAREVWTLDQWRTWAARATRSEVRRA